MLPWQPRFGFVFGSQDRKTSWLLVSKRKPATMLAYFQLKVCEQNIWDMNDMQDYVAKTPLKTTSTKYWLIFRA